MGILNVHSLPEGLTRYQYTRSFHVAFEKIIFYIGDKIYNLAWFKFQTSEVTITPFEVKLR